MDHIPDALIPSPFDYQSDRERSYTPTLRGSSASPRYTPSSSESFDLNEYLDPESYIQDESIHTEYFEPDYETSGLHPFANYDDITPSLLDEHCQVWNPDLQLYTHDDPNTQQDDEGEELADSEIVFPPVVDSDAEMDDATPFYFDDGNVLLRFGVGDPKKLEVVFKLHASVLASHSTVFRRRFRRALDGCSEDEGDAEDEEEVEVERRLDDAELEGMVLEIDLPSEADPEEFGWVVRAIYDASFFEYPPKRTKLKFILGILSVATDYGFDSLRSIAIAHLERVYPTTLILWQQRSWYATFDIRREYGPHPSTTVRETIAIIRTAVEAKVDHILPSALYELCAYDFRMLLGKDNNTHTNGRGASPLQMLSEDLEMHAKFILGRDVLKEWGKRMLVTMFDAEDIPPCTSEARREHCQRVRLGWVTTMSEWAYHRPFEAFSKVEIAKRLCGATLESDSDSGDDENEDRILCNSCQVLVLERFAEEADKIWEQLPAIFDIRLSWDEFSQEEEAEATQQGEDPNRALCGAGQREI